MLKWDEVKDCNGTNLHLFDAVQVITSDKRKLKQRLSQTLGAQSKNY